VLRRIRSLLPVLAIALAATAATAHGAKPRTLAPGLVHQGTKAVFHLPAGGAHACSLAVRYADGTTKNAGARVAVNRFATWTMAVPENAALGIAKWLAACGTAHLQGAFVVVRAHSKGPTGASAPPRVVVDKQGFSQRPDAFGNGSLLSFGLMLHNTSATEDATSVFVLVNMVDPAGALVGSISRSLTLIGASGVFAYGDSLHLRTQAPVSSLEITIRVGAHAPKTSHPAPDFANVRILPDDHNASWVGEVDGEVVNATPTLTLSSARLSIVVLDASGNVTGGGSGFSFGAVPSGARVVFTATSGLTALPTDKAATAVVSSEPTYTNGI
jgi:hypothetical protein